MADNARKHHAVVDAFAHLSADITEARSDADAKRLRSVTASALRAQLRGNPSTKALTPALTRLHHVVTKSARADLIQELTALETAGGVSDADEALVVIRRDERETLLSGRLIDSLSALSPGERIGPFTTHGSVNIWFDVFFAARRMEVRESGASAPALVFTQARPPAIRASTTSISIKAGTVWIRGDLINAGLPAAAFIGIKVTGGSLRLSRHATVSGDVVKIAAPLKGVLQLNLAPDEVTPVAGACASSGAKVTLPDSLTFTFDSGSSTVKGTAGKAKAWGQKFNFENSSAVWTFIKQLWTVVLEYDAKPQQFDADPVGDDLVHFEGVGEVNSAGLGLPVVVAQNPAILGEVAYAPGWFLRLKKLLARWYVSDQRLHELKGVWVGISAAGAALAAEGIAPLTPSVSHTYDLWTIAGGGDQRLPWRQTYEEPFSLFYRCDVIHGEHFMVQGQADVALDRPVTTNGIPVSTPTAQGFLLLHRFGGAITAMFGAQIEDEQSIQQFALRNALVWTSMPSFIYVSGELLDARRIDAGRAQFLLGVFAWSPTLPDPYVSNALIRPPARRRAPQSLLLGRVSWSAPDTVTVSFEGQLAPNPAMGARDASSGESRPARRGNGDPDVGPTQVEQDRLTFDRKTLAAREAAQATEHRGRRQRLQFAQRENNTSIRIIDDYMSKAVGPTPNLLLLDVSTNQDLLGVAVDERPARNVTNAVSSTVSPGGFAVSDLAVHSRVSNMRVVTLPQVQWEPVRTLDADQDILKMGWFPTPLASATDGGATQIGARSQKLMPVIPEDALQGTFDAYREGTPVGIRTTFPFGLVSAIQLQPQDTPDRKADLYGLTRPKFPDEQSVGGIQVTAFAEGGRSDEGGISPTFEGRMRQLLNGVDLPSGLPLGISVLGETTPQPAGSVEDIFNKNMAVLPRVPVTRLDLSGYGGSSFSDWNDPFAAFAATAKVQFRFMNGRTILEVIKVTSPWLPWGARLTRSVTIERRPGGGVIRRDSGWNPVTPGIFDYRYFDPVLGQIVVPPYTFDAGVFRGLFNLRNIRPAPGHIFTHGTAELVPYYADADVALKGVSGLTPAIGILGYLQIAPSGRPVDAAAIQALIEAQGPIGGPIDTLMNFGDSGLPFRAQRVEVGLAMDGGNPLFVATIRGAPGPPVTGAWSVVVRPVANVPANGGEAVSVAENRGVPVIRRYPVKFPANNTVFNAPPLSGVPGDYRFADAADLLRPATPANEYALMQSTPTHAFLFPRPFVPSAGAPRIESGHKVALADIFARSTSKGAFPPAGNTIELPPASLHLNVSPEGKLALSSPISIVGHPSPLRLAGEAGHGSSLFYDDATLRLEIEEDRWEAEFNGLRIWSDIAGLKRISGTEMRIVGSTEQRPQIAEIKSLILQEIEEIMSFIPIFGARGVQGPIDLGASNAKHELKVDAQVAATIPPPGIPAAPGAGVKLKLFVKQSTGIDKTGGAKASATFGAALEGKIPLFSVGVAAIFLIVSGEVTFSLTSVSGSVTSEKLELTAFVGVGVEGVHIGPFKAYAFLGVGFVLVYDAKADQTKYGGLVRLEAGVNLKIVKVMLRAELKGLVYKDAGTTKCDYGGAVKLQVDIFLIFSISATYMVTETTSF